MKSEKLQFSNTEGQTLVGRMDVPKEGEPIAYALFAHCFTCSKDLSAVPILVEWNCCISF